MECPVYAAKPRDPRLITKLVRNFRSHPDLISLPSRLFYEGELIACAAAEDVMQGALRAGQGASHVPAMHGPKSIA